MPSRFRKTSSLTRTVSVTRPTNTPANGLPDRERDLDAGGSIADPAACSHSSLDQAARALGCQLPTAFGYLMFLEITSIPDYAITDLGLIGVREQSALEPVLGPA